METFQLPPLHQIQFCMRVLVTVGTTQFDQLIRLIDSPPFIQTALKKGVQQLTLQIGRGKYQPKPASRIPTTVIRFTDNMDKLLETHDLIVCHTGAGTILQCLCKGKQILTVINQTLQGNHQSELLEEVTKLQGVKGTCVNDFLGDFEELEPRRKSEKLQIKGQFILQRVWNQLFVD